MLNRFHHCWIPDLKGLDSIAGNISEPTGQIPRATHIGLLSRFKSSTRDKTHKVLCILSGPEPQRSQLEEKVLKQLLLMPGNHVLVRGTLTKFVGKQHDCIEIIDMIDGSELEELIDTSEYLISRSGYSSIMDYLVKGRKALLIPTPGQAEQISLSNSLRKGRHFIIQEQKELDIKKALDELAMLPDPKPLNDNKLLMEVLEDFCTSLF